MASVRDILNRRIGPWLVLVADDIRAPRRAVEVLRHRLGGRTRVELYLAFDDPYSALAMVQVAAMAAARDCELELFPVVRRGIQGDPDGELRRRHALTDARRLARRTGLPLARATAPLEQEVAFLAEWTESARACGAAQAFAAAAMKALWMEGDGEIRHDAFADLYRHVCATDPPARADGAGAAVRANEKRLIAKGHWETPAARIAGEWFFAHERLPAMNELLDYLGAASAA